MPTYPELTAAGLVTIDATQHLENMQDGIAGSSEFGATVSTGPFSVTGQILGVVAVELGELNELDQAIYDSQNPQNAQGLALDNVNGIRGVTRNGATQSTVSVDLTGTAGTPIPALSQVRQTGSIYIWETTEDVVLPASVDIRSITPGPVEALATTIDEIFTPISGWTGVDNPLDAEPGDPIENDSDYFLRGERSLSRGGSSTDQAMRARIEDLVPNVEAAAVRSNRSLSTTIDGQPPKSIWINVYPNTVDQVELAKVIWDLAGAPQGIEMFGAVSKTIIDDQEYPQTMKWDWGTDVDGRIKVYLTTNTLFPGDGAIQAQNAVLAYAQLYTMGQNIDPAPIQDSITKLVPGITAIQSTQKIGSTPAPGDTAPVEVDFNKVANVIFSDIDIVVS